VIGEKACAESFVDHFGKRAFRRPLTPSERSALLVLYDGAAQEAGFASGIRIVIEAALQMPQFLYRLEFGAADEVGEEIVRLDDWEIASRLSYLLWGSMPDDELLAAAERGDLSTAKQIEDQARRMLADPRARDAVTEFHAQWLDYYRIESVGKDPVLFPEYTPELGELMRQEIAALIDHVVFGERGGLAELLTAPYTFLNRQLATFYGETGPIGTAFEKVDLDPSRRAGIVTAGALMAINAHSNQTSPVHRGKLVREQYLCETMPPPPPGVTIMVPEPDPSSSARERFAQHSADPACKGCHTLMDPIGFGFESYDSLGRSRDTENGQPIDDSGEIVGSDVPGPFDGAIELAGKLASSAQVQECYVTQWFRYGYGRGETVDDSCNLGRLNKLYDAGDGDIAELLVALTQTDAFLYRRAEVQP
jgi:hypothetical protein